MDEKKGGIQLLEDEHYNQLNPWGKPVVSWKTNSQGLGGLYNPRGYAMLRVVLTKLMDGIMRPIYL